MAIENYYDQTITIKRLGVTKDAGGAPINGYTTHLTIKGAIEEKSGRERFVNDKKTLYSSHTLYCANADILQSDKAYDEAGKEYDIVFVNNPIKMNHHLEIDLLFKQ